MHAGAEVFLHMAIAIALQLWLHQPIAAGFHAAPRAQHRCCTAKNCASVNAAMTLR